ncbi:LysR family transcriptional regulator [Paraburkholderia fungorum]|uniref:LysR family transcriptional regulator n=1 Tax=Paraburkholderia fungorum TaxID=134537 RepID=A0A420GYE2_9BURK|nr:LysR family transcriptional regulator [Paraburkholderia fungorum]RKF50116.1 LysR family transcriptional regulator [Paraburkholderia fungorum]
MVNFRLVRHLWLFLAVAEEGNFGRAARRLNMSQPPLTEQIQILEQALKVRLFERSRKGAQLTPVGAAILPAVRKFADQLERLEFAVREAVEGHSGLLTIGAITSAMVDVLPPLVTRLKAEYPQLTISVREIDSAEAVPALLAGDVDLAFARLEGDLAPTIESTPLKQDRLVVAVPSEHPMASLTRIRLATLSNENFVMFPRHVSPVYFDSLIAACRANGFSPRILHHVRSVASQVAFVACGQGIALVPESLRSLASENVVFRPLKENVSVVTIAMAWKTDRDSPLITSVLSSLGRRRAVA